jgi:predicted nucleic acid-binding protein
VDRPPTRLGATPGASAREYGNALSSRGRPRQANDTWIAACCLVYGLPLATHNVKDFADYAEHEGLELITE